MDRRLRFCFSSFLALALSACGFAEGEDDVDIAFIGNPGDVR